MLKFRNDGRWDGTTVPSIDSLALYSATTAPHDGGISDYSPLQDSVDAGVHPTAGEFAPEDRQQVGRERDRRTYGGAPWYRVPAQRYWLRLRRPRWRIPNRGGHISCSA